MHSYIHVSFSLLLQSCFASPALDQASRDSDAGQLLHEHAATTALSLCLDRLFPVLRYWLLDEAMHQRGKWTIYCILPGLKLMHWAMTVVGQCLCVATTISSPSD